MSNQQNFKPIKIPRYTCTVVKSYYLKTVHYSVIMTDRAYLRVTVLDTNGARIIVRSLVQHLHTVPLGGDRGGKVDGYHLKESIASW